MTRALALAAFLLASGACMDGVEWVDCHEEDQIVYVAETTELCPREEQTRRAVSRVEEIGGIDRDAFSGYRVHYSMLPRFDHPPSVGFTDLGGRRIAIANCGYREAVLRHELFHVAMDFLTGDPDVDHTDPRWPEIADG